MQLHTEIKYSYKNQKGATVHKKCVLYHRISEQDINAVTQSLYKNKFFIAYLIGIPCDKKTGYGESADIAADPWFKLDSIKHTDAEETVLITAEQFATRFRHMAGHWTDKLPQDYHEPRWVQLDGEIQEH